MKPGADRRRLLIEREEGEIASVYPNLHFLVDGETIRLRGGFPVRAGEVVVDHFQVDILLAPDHPVGVPIAWELGGRVRPSPENHVSGDGQLCLFLPEERADNWPLGSRVLSFLTGPLNSYFVGFLHFRAHGEWPFGERRHGLAGVLDFYSERTGIAGPEGVLGAIAILVHGGVKGHWDCPCGSGNRIRACHPGILALRETVTPSTAAASLRQIVDVMKKAEPGASKI